MTLDLKTSYVMLLASCFGMRRAAKKLPRYVLFEFFDFCKIRLVLGVWLRGSRGRRGFSLWFHWSLKSSSTVWSSSYDYILC